MEVQQTQKRTSIFQEKQSTFCRGDDYCVSQVDKSISTPPLQKKCFLNLQGMKENGWKEDKKKHAKRMDEICCNLKKMEQSTSASLCIQRLQIQPNNVLSFFKSSQILSNFVKSPTCPHHITSHHINVIITNTRT